jgi:prepilin-type N-terminal cleavage/methylation domain-containing protein
MRRALTLIEMIFSMIIIAVVFTIVPKIIFASNKAIALGMKEDALFNAYALMGSITKLAWDENTIISEGKILNTTDNTCSDYRVGGFLGSRNCIDSTLFASSIGLEGADYNDVDDYNGYLEPITLNGENRYNLGVTVAYGSTQEIKSINVSAQSHADNNKIKNFQSSFFYDSANLGQINIKKEQWQ